MDGISESRHGGLRWLVRSYNRDAGLRECCYEMGGGIVWNNEVLHALQGADDMRCPGLKLVERNERSYPLAAGQ